MISKKDLIVTVLATFCVTSLLFVTIPIRSAPTNGGYDPWTDTNDDGIIDYEDLYNLASRFRTSGTPINKTDLLLELNTTVTDLLSRVEDLEEPITTIRIEDGAVTGSKIANSSIRQEKLGRGAIPYAAVSATAPTAETTAVGYANAEDMEDMSVDITVYKWSILLITFSAEAAVLGPTPVIYIRAMVDGEQAEPASNNIILTQHTAYHSHSFTFYKSVTTGTYNVKIQWWVTSGDHGYVDDRSLVVIALPYILRIPPIIIEP